MRSSGTLTIAMVTSLLLGGSARGQTSILAEVDFTLGDISAFDAVEMQVSLSDDDGTVPGPPLFDGVLWTPADIGKAVTLTTESDPDFAETAARLINGDPDWIVVQLFDFPVGGVSGFGTLEANFFEGQAALTNGVDLRGLEIQSIGLRLNSSSPGVSAWSLIITGSPCGQESRVFVVNACDDVEDGACDEAQCSLREAILDANRCPSHDSIEFAVVGGVPCWIFPQSPLPPITEPVLIDATTQPDAGIFLAGVDIGIPSDGLVIDADDTIVRGLTIITFSEAAIRIRDASGCHVEGNVLGDDGSHTSIGVLIEGGSGNVVGGPEPGQGNRIEHPYSSGLGIGVELRPGANGPAIANRIEGNHILNMDYGVVAAGRDNTIGGLAAGAGNAIEGFRRAGVLVSDGDGSSAGNAILSNSITGFDLLGIDLGGDGPTPNDPFDGDRGANDLQNHPVLESARVDAGTVTVAGALYSTLFTEFRIELFASVNVPPAEIVLGSITGTSDVEGKLEFEASFPWDSMALGTIAATATNLETHDSSELSDFVAMRQVFDRDGDHVEDELDNCPDLSNPDQADTDVDGAGDACDADDDDDGLSDSYEASSSCLDAGVPDASVDSDADGLTSAEEFNLGSDPCRLDSDDDGLPDGAEIFGSGAFGTDPLDPDTDDDGALDGSDNCPRLFYEETNQSGSNPDQADLDRDGLGNVCDPDVDGDGIPNAADSCRTSSAAGFDADSDGCRDSLSGFAGLVGDLDDVTESVRKTLLRKGAEVEHLVCDVENVNGGLNKLQDLGGYVGAQTGKSITAATSEALRSYLDNLTQLIGNGSDVCSLP